jgi:hypothetical protein
LRLTENGSQQTASSSRQDDRQVAAGRGHQTLTVRTSVWDPDAAKLIGELDRCCGPWPHAAPLRSVFATRRRHPRALRLAAGSFCHTLRWIVSNVVCGSSFLGWTVVIPLSSRPPSALSHCSASLYSWRRDGEPHQSPLQLGFGDRISTAGPPTLAEPMARPTCSGCRSLSTGPALSGKYNPVTMLTVELIEGPLLRAA